MREKPLSIYFSVVKKRLTVAAKKRIFLYQIADVVKQRREFKGLKIVRLLKNWKPLFE